MSEDVIISVEHLSKRYKLGQIGATTLRESSERFWHRLRGRDPSEHMGKVGGAHRKPEAGNLKPETGQKVGKTEDATCADGPRLSDSEIQVSGFIPHPSSDDLWALKDVSFEVKRGEVLGIIGRNGAGKSTLLKILSRITEPTSGRAILRGRLASLLEVGTGFHPELTGRENIYLNGAILGMRKKEIAAKFDEIVAFSEVERFVDTPVKRYSSGMYVRLAFAVAAHLDPEILLVDEVLAVGDIAFQKKCLGKMEDIAGHGRTVIFVSHNMQAVRNLCRRGILLHSGGVEADTSSSEAIAKYNDLLKTVEVDASTSVDNPQRRRGSGAVRFTSIKVQKADGGTCQDFEMGETIRFDLAFHVFERTFNLYVAVALRSGRNRECVASARHSAISTPLADGECGSITIEWPHSILLPGDYLLYFWLGDQLGRPYDVVDDLTAPLSITTRKSFEELGFDPTQPSGYFKIESHLTGTTMSTSR